jgi:hypothetical protein
MRRVKQRDVSGSKKRLITLGGQFWVIAWQLMRLIAKQSPTAGLPNSGKHVADFNKLRVYFSSRVRA